MSEFVMPSDAEIRALNWLAENYAMGDEDGPTLHLHVEKLEGGGGLLFLVANDGSHHRFSRALADYAEDLEERCRKMERIVVAGGRLIDEYARLLCKPRPILTEEAT